MIDLFPVEQRHRGWSQLSLDQFSCEYIASDRQTVLQWDPTEEASGSVVGVPHANKAAKKVKSSVQKLTPPAKQGVI